MSLPPIFPLAFGAFKIGRNEKIKYPAPYDLPSDGDAERLLHGALDLGINLIDTAPAYGISEERIGRFLAPRRDEFLLSTKAGEEFADGRSRYDFSPAAVRASLHRSLARLKTDRVDFLLLHGDGSDIELAGVDHPTIIELQRLREEGLVRWIGTSPKFAANARHALPWADVLMLEISPDAPPDPALLADARARGTAILAKKALGSGRLPAREALASVLAHEAVTAVVVGTLNLAHLADNAAAARKIRKIFA